MRPKGYIVRSNGVAAMLSQLTWKHVRSQVDQAFAEAGSLQAVYAKDYRHAGLIDGVVEIFADSGRATRAFRSTVAARLVAEKSNIPEVEALWRRFVAANYTVADGRSYILKGLFQPNGPYRKRLICFSYGAVSMSAAFATWQGFLNAPRIKTRGHMKLTDMKTASTADQTDFGKTLGNLIAHELRHQLALSKDGSGNKPQHSSSGLGKDGASYHNPKLEFDGTDKRRIVKDLGIIRDNSLKFMAEAGLL